MSKPITPSQLAKRKKAGIDIPSEVFDAFNEMISKNWNGCYSTVQQPEVVALIEKKLKAAGRDPEKPENDMFENHWLDVEDVYRKAGWSVKYDKPGYNESYEAYFEFKPRRRKSSGDCGFRE